MINVYDTVEKIPAEWDRAAGNNLALQKANLALLAKVNPCHQRYVVFTDQEIYAILVQYVLQLDIFSYSKLHFRLPVTIIGIPCSVAEPGYQAGGDTRLELKRQAEVKAYLTKLKGAKLVLNAGNDLDFLGFSKGFTLPNCIMDVGWQSFEAYLQSLRSHYRYRYKKALQKASMLKLEQCGSFDQGLYKLYEQVFQRSGYKLEKLPIEFFQQSPATVAVFKRGRDPVAFVQYVISDRRLIFLFGGLDYNLNKEYDLYQNMLLLLIRTAIEQGCASISLGQTAEEVKCRLGARLETKYLYLHHSNRVINWLAAKFSRLFSYDIPEVKLQVFIDKREDAS